MLAEYVSVKFKLKFFISLLSQHSALVLGLKTTWLVLEKLFCCRFWSPQKQLEVSCRRLIDSLPSPLATGG